MLTLNKTRSLSPVLIHDSHEKLVNQYLSYEVMPHCVLGFKLNLPLCGTRNLNHKLFK